MKTTNFLKAMKTTMSYSIVLSCVMSIFLLTTGCQSNKNSDNKTTSNIKTDSIQTLLSNLRNEYKLGENEIDKLSGTTKEIDKLSQKMMLSLIEKRNSLERLITNNPQDTLINIKMKELSDYRIRCTQIADSILLIYKK